MKLSQSMIDKACEALATGADVVEAPAWIETPKCVYWVEHDIGDTVYLVNRDEPLKGIVTGIGIRPGGHFFNVRWATGQEDGHFGIELTSEKEL